MNNAINGVHDPTIIEANGTYYMVSTDTQQPKTSGVPIRSSKDLIHWRFEKTALEDGVPAEADAWTGATNGLEGLWAPEIIKYNNEYRMYYSASTFGSTTSYIGLASAPHPLGPWEDRGEVVKTAPHLASHNAIDANICTDRDGEQWFTYGSFFGGIHICAVDKATGKLKDPSDYGKLIAIRPQSVEGAIEGPFIYYNEKTDDFYLFVSFDSLNDTYNIRVGRSKEITGPYLDRNGRELTELTGDPNEVGTKLLGSYQYLDEAPLYGPGHNSIFRRSDGAEFCVHHIRRVPHTADFFVGIRQLYWTSDGWPLVSADFYNGDQPKKAVTASDLTGGWEIVMFNKTSDLIPAVKQELTDVTISPEGIYRCALGEFIPYWQPTTDGLRLELSGLSEAGLGFIGRKL